MISLWKSRRLCLLSPLDARDGVREWSGGRDVVDLHVLRDQIIKIHDDKETRTEHFDDWRKLRKLRMFFFGHTFQLAQISAENRPDTEHTAL